jgi:hypothetical protein
MFFSDDQSFFIQTLLKPIQSNTRIQSNIIIL